MLGDGYVRVKALYRFIYKRYTHHGYRVFSKNMSLDKRSKIFLLVGLVSEVVKIFFYIIKNEETHGGILPKTDLPFHLCSLQIIFVAAVCFCKNEKIRRILIAFIYPSALIGGAAAILIPTSSSLNYWVITIQYFIYHTFLVAYAIGLIVDGKTRFNICDYFSSLAFVFGLMFFSIYINSIVYDGVTEVNFMYVVSPPVSGLPYLTEEFGWAVYIAHYAFLVLFSITACYSKQIYTALKDKISASKKSEAKNNLHV